MRQHSADETAWAGPHPAQRRGEGSRGVSDVLLGLQRSVGNAAVAGQLGAHGPGTTSFAAPMAFVQRCGPTPCNCSADERADYAEKHPDEPASPEAGAPESAHDHG